MKNITAKKMIKKELEKQGLNFSKSPFELSTSETLLCKGYAKEVHYRKPKNSYFSTGTAFYEHLQKIK